MEPRIDVILRSYPVTTQTFHYQRIAELARMDVLGTVWVESRADGHIDPELEATFVERVEFIGDLPAPSASAMSKHSSLVVEAARLTKANNGEGGPAGAVKQTLSGIRLGEHLRSHPGPSILHAAFSTANLTIARAAAHVAKLPYSTEVHSPLSWFRNPAWFRAKVADAAVVAVISDYTRKRVISVCPEAREQIVEVHCGLPPRPEANTSTTGESKLTSVGGLVSKKGHDTFIRACALLGERGQVIGGGDLAPELTALVDELEAPVEMMDELPHPEVLDRIANSRVGVLAARHGEAGDEDGLPVVLLEFMRAGVPVVSTPIAGIPALLRTSGSLAVANDEVALAGAIQTVIDNPDNVSSDARRAAGHLDASYGAETEAHKLIAALTSTHPAGVQGA